MPAVVAPAAQEPTTTQLINEASKISSRTVNINRVPQVRLYTTKCVEGRFEKSKTIEYEQHRRFLKR